MKKILYIDMDGVINLFEHDPNARINMWNSGYFYNIGPRENIELDLIEISKYVDEIVILTKRIEREGVEKEKRKFVKRYLSHVNNLSIIFVPYVEAKVDYIDSNCFSILLDDGLKNVIECEKKCDICILFDENDKYEYKNKVRNIRDILKYVS